MDKQRERMKELQFYNTIRCTSLNPPHAFIIFRICPLSSNAFTVWIKGSSFFSPNNEDEIALELNMSIPMD